MESERLSEVFKLLGDPVRLEIICALSLQPLSVCEIVSLTGKSQPCISYHLRMLKAYGLINAEKEGKFTIFSIIPDGNDGLNREVMEVVKNHMDMEKIKKKVDELNRIGRENICGKFQDIA